MSSIGIYKEKTDVNHTGVILVYNNHITTLDFDPHLFNESSICCRTYTSDKIIFDWNNENDFYDFGMEFKQEFETNRKIFVKMIKHLKEKIEPPKLLFNIGDYHIFDNNCRVHVCKTLKIFEREYSYLSPEEILYCWDVVFDSAISNYNKVLIKEEIFSLIYDTIKKQYSIINIDMKDLSLFVSNIIFEHCLKNYVQVLYPSEKPKKIIDYINTITLKIDKDKYHYISREIVISIVYNVLYYLDYIHNIWC